MVLEDRSWLLYSWLMGVEQLDVSGRRGAAALSGVSYIQGSSAGPEGGVGARVLRLCALLSECPDSLALPAAAGPASLGARVGVEVAKAGQVELWPKAIRLGTAGSLRVEHARLRGRAVG